MEFSGRLFLAAIEEDNTQRSLFRVRPLLSEEGSVSQEEIESLGDEGFLRVVPDRAEQHTFKDRMRELGRLCLIDLRNMSGEISKVRSNKNYSPKSGEVNRFVIYSDAIQPVAEAELYEVVAEGRDTNANTRHIYLRRGGHIQGPFLAGGTEPAASLCCIAPDNSRLFSVSMPDGKERLYYWPKQPQRQPTGKAPVKEEAGEGPELQAALSLPENQNAAEGREEALPDAADTKEANLAIETAAHPDLETQETPEADAREQEAVQPAALAMPREKTMKISAAPIHVKGRHSSSGRKDTLSLSSVLDRGTRGNTRPQEPSASVEDPRLLRPVENPAEQLKKALGRLWSSREGKEQALDAVLKMDGADQALCEKLSGGEGQALHSMAHQQLNSLEAERLALVMELEKLQSSRADLLKAALSEGGRQGEELEKRREELAFGIRSMEEQCRQLSNKRAELLKELEPIAAETGAARGMGEECGPQKASRLLASVLSAAGFEASINDAMNLLILSMTSPRLALAADEAEDARYAAHLLAHALGALLVECETGEEPLVLPGGDAAAFALYQGEAACPSREMQGLTCLTTGDRQVLPSVRLIVKKGFMPEMEPRQGVCVSRRYLLEQINAARREIPSGTLELLAKAEEALACRLPLTLKRKALNYIASAQSLLDGGIAAAVDYAFACLLIPYAVGKRLNTEALKSLCAGMTAASSLL